MRILKISPGSYGFLIEMLWIYKKKSRMCLLGMHIHLFPASSSRLDMAYTLPYIFFNLFLALIRMQLVRKNLIHDFEFTP